MQRSRLSIRLSVPLLGLFLTVLTVCLALTPAQACDTPVFIYGMENWTADRYDVIIYHQGNLSDDQQKTVKYLQDNAAPYGIRANIRVKTINLSEEQDKDVQLRYAALKAKSLPWVAVVFPKRGVAVETGEFCGVLESEQRLCWDGPLSRDTLENLLDSPTRRKIVSELVSKRSIPWVMLESGNATKDEVIYKKLTNELTKLHNTLKPSQTLYTEDGKEGDRVNFSIIRVSRSDPKEQMLVQMLLQSEPDIANRTDPMVFPLYARGIILYALVGAGINTSNLHNALAFIIGPCSCEVKDRNPGVEMLISTDWMARMETMSSDSIPPPASITTFAQSAEKARKISEASIESAKTVAAQTQHPTKPARPAVKAATSTATKIPAPRTKTSQSSVLPSHGTETAASATATTTLQDTTDDVSVARVPDSTTETSTEEAAVTPKAATTESGESSLVRNLFYLLLMGVVIVTGITLILKSRGRTKGK